MKRVAVIGGGVAGMQTALRLAEQGIEPVIIEKEAELGGKLRGWHVLFPSFTPASEILLIAHCYPSCILSIVQPDPAKKRFRKTIFYAQRCIGTATVRPMTEAPLSPAPPP